MLLLKSYNFLHALYVRYMRPLTNRANPDLMSHAVLAFHQDLHCLQKP